MQQTTFYRGVNNCVEKFECHVQAGRKRQERWLEYHSMPILSGLYAGGRVELYYDISQRKKYEEELVQAKNTWESTFDAVPDLIAILDDQHRIVKANKAMIEKLGVEKIEPSCLFCYKHVHGIDKPPGLLPALAIAAGRPGAYSGSI